MNTRGDHFAVGSSKGFQIYSTGNNFELENETCVPGGVKVIQLMTDGSKHFVALVGSGKDPAYPPHKVVFWEVGNEIGSSEINFVPHVLSLKAVAGIIVAGM